MFRSTNPLAFETLEDKRLLTCDVAFDGEKLEISCEQDADPILINEFQGDLIVNDVNLGSAANLKDVVIDSANIVVLSDLTIEDSVEIKLSCEIDTLILNNVNIGNDLKIDTRGGDDMVFFQGDVSVANTAEIELGKGADLLSAKFGTLTADNDIKIDGGRGRDTLEAIDNFYAGNELETKSIKIIS